MEFPYGFQFWALFFIVCAHLSATTSRPEFRQTLDDLETIIDVVPNDAILMCGLDANCNLGGADSRGCLVGPFTGDADPATAADECQKVTEWKAWWFAQLLFRHRLQAYNSLLPGPSGQITHFCDGETAAPRQIDYFLGRRLPLKRLRCEAAFSEATESDHRPVLLQYALNDDETLQQADAVDIPTKPVGWKVTDTFMFNSEVEERFIRSPGGIQDKTRSALSPIAHSLPGWVFATSPPRLPAYRPA